IYHDAKRIFHQISMNLREWISNDPTVTKEFDETDRTKSTTTKFLGIPWNPVSDEIRLQIHYPQNTEQISKRTALQTLAFTFDPLGYLSPIIFKAKTLIQDMWKNKIGCDEPIPENFHREWEEFYQTWQKRPSFTVPRKIIEQGDGTTELHCFVDASVKGYAACIYLRSSSAQKTTCNLLYAKSRLAPTKQITIPRLELMAALIGTRALTFVTEQLQLKTLERFMWTDSKCILRWLRTTKILPTFILNRVREIKQAKNIHFKYVTSSHNPADFATRGLTPEELSSSKLWWNGPP
ncbi:hypothetical protein Tcan_01254, partial [Toxocara canis]